MAITPIVRDANGHALPMQGTEIFTKRITSIPDTGTAVTLPVDCKYAYFLVEGTAEVMRLTGTASGSTEVVITSDGIPIPPPSGVFVAVESGEPIFTVKAPTGTTINLSIVGWR